MPYDTIKDLPLAVRNTLPEEAQKIWLEVFNKTDGEESQAAATAWAAVKNAGYEKTNNWRKSNMNFFSEWRLMESKDAEVQIFPAVGIYKHPEYGDLNISTSFLQTVKSNFDQQVYQQDLPVQLDLEHEGKLSGANGWVKSLDIRGDKGMWAIVGLTDRGHELLSGGNYRYFSPEFYDEWTDPATGKAYANLLVGGAFTNRPFFKGMSTAVVLNEGKLFAFSELVEDKPMMKTEDGMEYPAEAYLYVPDPQKPDTWKLRIWESPEAKVTVAQLGRAAAAMSPGGFRGQRVQMPDEDMQRMKAKLVQMYKHMDVAEDDIPAHIMANETGGKTMSEQETRQMAEMADQIKALKESLATTQAESKANEEARKVAEAAADKALKMAESLQKDARHKRFTETVYGRGGEHDGAAWPGEVAAHVGHMEKLAETFGDDSPELNHYISTQSTVAKQLNELLSRETGSAAIPEGSPQATFDAKVKKFTEGGMSAAEAVRKVTSEDPQLYAEVRKASYTSEK